MSTHRTHEETRAELVGSLGEELGAVFHQLQTDLAWLHIKWQQYRELYGTKPERIGLLNEAASLFFRIVEDALWDDTLISITRLTEHTSGGPSRRLTIQQLPALITNEKIKAEVKQRVAVAVEKARFAKDWRNRRIAHRNMSYALEPEATPLAHASRSNVEEALEALRNVLNTVDRLCRDSTFLYEMADHAHGAESMLYVLRDGLETRGRRLAAMRDGTLPPDEWVPRTI
jgi:hypothetical protein